MALGGDVRLDASSNEKSGSTFIVEIRAPHSDGFEYWSDFHEAVTMAGEAATALGIENARNKKGGFLTGMNVLVVDDAGDNRTLISRFLVAAGAKVDCAVDGFDGIDHALKNNYDVVLINIQMPQLDGYSATKQLRAGGYKRPIIALNAHALKEERESSIRAGCDDHLTKPIDRTTLIERVAKFGAAAAEAH